VILQIVFVSWQLYTSGDLVSGISRCFFSARCWVISSEESKVPGNKEI
jgi:hypothetical protein